MLYLAAEIRNSFRVPIVTFYNRRKDALVLVVQPFGQKHEVPHRSEAGIRYELQAGGEDRSYCDVSDCQVDFWCNADSYEFEIVHPSPQDNLLWDICINGGWCGGLVDGKPCHVLDLIPATGMVTAREFAELAVRADGWPPADALPEKYLQWLEGKFVEHLEAEAVSCEKLHRLTPSPFSEAQP